ncbi:MAG TPA: bifunctional glutamate N-acetyltransferase/amino-acid acetyltransferase ArgJ [Clostridia bacterium]|jgi:glutamate N-acetyltransferase/amino-acid N-acetyltransferase|nr:bifunctional glutamate N-acetyltransferase/amino-acid acetyltransferase ArgJ [Clostridia bacterium]
MTKLIKKIDGGVCAPKGFKANAVHCGIRKNRNKRDLTLIYSEVKGTAAAVYTLNLVKGAPIYVTQNNIKDGYAQAMICNSGNANTCNANGVEIAEKTCSILAKELNISEKDIIIASTGVIGQTLNIEPFEEGIPRLVNGLGYEKSSVAAEGIMTTDTKMKEVAVTFMLGDKECVIGGIAKGSGMINPNMATMLVFLTTDVNISQDMLKEALKEDVKCTYNMVSVDGDTSTNDMVSIIANGQSGNQIIKEKNSDYKIFVKALNVVNSTLCEMIAKDGEGATKLMRVHVSGAVNNEDAQIVAKSVVNSSLVKAAMFGADANWGRILCAIGYSGMKGSADKVDVTFQSAMGKIDVCEGSFGIDFSERIAKEVLSAPDIDVLINLNEGKGMATAWGCDLTYDYVKINGDYRT